MSSGKTRSVWIGAAIALAATAWWISGFFISGTETTLSTSVSKDTPDYTIENPHIDALDKKGRKRYTLKAKRLTHFSSKKISNLEYPDLVQFNVGNESVHTTADHGVLSADRSRITMTGNVRIIQQLGGKQDGSVITSKELTVILE